MFVPSPGPSVPPVMANRATGSPPDVSIDADPRDETLTPSEARVVAAVRVTEVSPPRTGRVLTPPSAGSPHPNVGSASAAVSDKLSPNVERFIVHRRGAQVSPQGFRS